MYNLYIPKIKGENPPYKITKVLKLFSENLTPNLLICAPGYMSVTEETIDEFVEKLIFNIIFIKSSNIYIGLPYGMNGRKKAKSNKGTVEEILEIHKKKIDKRGININFNFKKNDTDHRKMIFFAKFKEGKVISTDEKFGKDNIKELIDKIDLIGILLGSSNQSNRTYFKSPAHQGESDVLFFRDEKFSKILEILLQKERDEAIQKARDEDILNEEMQNTINSYFGMISGCVLFKSIAGVNSEADEKQCMEDILIDYLNGVLDGH